MIPKYLNLLLALCLAMGGLVFTAPATAQDSIPNDLFVNAMEVILNFHHEQDTFMASKEENEPTCTYGTISGSVWFKYTPDHEMQVRINTQNSSYNHEIAVFTGDIDTGLTSHGCTTSRQMELGLAAGTTYFIRVASWYEYWWDENWGGWLVIDITELAPPENDNFASVSNVTELPANFLVDTTRATLEVNEPWPSCLPAGQDFGKTVWFAYTASHNQVLHLTISPYNFPSLMTLYTGSTLEELQELACGAVEIAYSLAAGTTYYLQIGGQMGNSGMTYLTLDLPAPPANDMFADAHELVVNYTYISSDNRGATVETGEPAPSCLIPDLPHSTLWYKYTTPAEGLLKVPSNGPFVAVYQGDSIDGLTESACFSSPGAWQLWVEAGETFYLQVGSPDFSVFSFELTVQFIPIPANDGFANAEIVPPLPFSATAELGAATLESGEKLPSCAPYTAQTVWYRYTPTVDVSIKSSINYDGFIAIYNLNEGSSLTEVKCQSCWDYATPLKVLAGQTYYIQVGSSYGYQDNIGFQIYETPPPVSSFWYVPSWGVSIYDTIFFYNNSYDMEGGGWDSVLWDFGDGTTSSDWSPAHRYVNDGDYSVNLTVTTTDGRSASASQTVSVRTHDVAITRFATPVSAKAGHTRALVISLRNNRYPENVQVELYKGTPYGEVLVGTLSQFVPVRPASRTTNVSLDYTFTPEDAAVGKVTFRVIVSLLEARDAIPADNQSISMPIKVIP